eukprot:2978291-Ditylum_brightwellii.AAC.1
MKFAYQPKHTSPTMIDDHHHKALLAKLMHGKFFTQQGKVPGVDLTQSHIWLWQAGLCCKTEAAIYTAQDQTIPHIASRCDMLCNTKYTKKYNKVCRYLHWCILQDEGCQVVPNWRQYKAEETPFICFDTECTLRYNITQRVGHAIAANRPDLVVLDKKKRTALLINVTCPMDINMVTAAATKYKKYCDLKSAMKKQYEL